MPGFVMSWMWRWVAVALLTAATPGAALPSTTVIPPDHQDHVDKEVQALKAVAAASRQPLAAPESQSDPTAQQPTATPSARQPKLLSPDRQPKLLERDRESRRKTLDRGASELAWKNWLQSPESRDPGAPPRRITPKSVFIAPSNCPEGRRIGEGCVSVHQVGKEAHEQYILEQLNNLGAQGADDGGVEYDYDETTGDGPLQLNLPLGPAFVAAASQNVITAVPANEKKDGNRRTGELVAELERLKQELERLASVSEHEPLASIALAEHSTSSTGKPKREHEKPDHAQKVDEDKLGETATSEPEREQENPDDHEQKDTPGENTAPVTGEPEREHEKPADHGQKEIIFGDVSEDKLGEHATRAPANPERYHDYGEKIIFNTSKDTLQHSIVNQTLVEATTGRQNATTESTVSDEPTTRTPPKPEIEYADIGDAVKLISRYAEVTTDDSFKGEPKRPPENGPLGTRTRAQHRRNPSVVGIYAPPSIYADRLAAHLAYRRPPPDYPFRHVQEYWTHPERYLGPYAHANPRRHHHAYPRRPSPPRTDEADLYRLLELRRWYSGDAAADR